MTDWKSVYPNPDALELAGTFPGEEEALRYRGLELVPLYDYESQIVWHDSWELRLAKTGYPLLHIWANGQRAALQWATQVAEGAQWERLEGRPDWFGPLISAELRDLIRRNREVFFEPSYPTDIDLAELQDPRDLDHLIPYGD